MQHRRPARKPLLGAVQFWAIRAALALGLGACSGAENCDGSRECLLAQAQANQLNDAPEPCSQLGEDDCRRSGHCFLDSVCAASPCNGTRCSDSCELVRVCVDH